MICNIIIRQARLRRRHKIRKYLDPIPGTQAEQSHIRREK